MRYPFANTINARASAVGLRSRRRGPGNYAVAAGPGSSEGHRLIADLVDTFFTAYQRQGDMVDLETGLAAISQHVRSLGYDGVILFLDELILWLATHLANVEFVTTEASKLAALVEASKADRPVPIISFIARQRDLTEFVDVGLPGANRMHVCSQAGRPSHTTRTVA
jgi:hypothetical protein